MIILCKVQSKLIEEFMDEMDRRVMYNALDPKSKEEIEKETAEYNNRKCYAKDNNGKLICARRETGEIYKVDGYEMTDEPLPDAVFGRWATGFDL